MRNKDQFMASLHDGREVYYRGKRVDSIPDHSVLRIAALHAAKLFEMDRMIADEKLGNISKYFKIPASEADLIQRHRLIYETTMACNGIFNISQAIGSDALFALKIVSAETDAKYGTTYSKAVEKYRSHVAENDLTLAVAQTDVKGDRKKRPHEQTDPDMYVHVSKVEKEGIIVNGAKAHTTQAAVSDEIIVLPTRAMTEKDKEYTVAFAIPASTKGLKFIVRPIDELEGNSSAIISKRDYELETLTIFENVFVPWSRVFLFREFELAGRLAVLFATFHRFTAVSYRSATANLYLGTAIAVAKENGISEAAHVKNRLVDLVMYKELMRMSAVAAAYLPVIAKGIAVPDPLYTNIGKLYSNEHFSRVLDALVDVSGGIISTLPSFEDQTNDMESKLISKYLSGAGPGEKRMKVLRLAKELGASSFTGYMLALMLHAEGSVEASKLALLRDADLGEAEQVIEKILSSDSG
ncbi:MAG: 4-hydroxybutyryl-CoA dehydratase [Thaumarchaeota archaeon]|nr:4-hydroxybutyryl-CoA dehydratase [Nitrososphaerota archaeon]